MTTNIQNLLDKYFEEQTTATEEAQLRDYFRGVEVAPELEIYRSVFQVVEEDKELSLSSTFDQKIMVNIVGELIEKYFSGETTIAEEQDLRDYFEGEDVAEELKKYQSWFAFLQSEKKLEVSASFEEGILSQLDMNTSQLSFHGLTEKYFAGETTLAEEKSLKDYYNSENVSVALKSYQVWFQQLSTEAEQTVSADFDSRLMTQIKGKSAELKVVRSNNNWMRIAAGVALLLGVVFFLQRNLNTTTSIEQTAEVKQIDWSKYEVKTKEEALAETEEAMRLLAEAFGASTKEAAKSLNNVEEVSKALN